MTETIANLAAKAINDNAAHQQSKGESPVIRKLFLLLHGSYGNLFTSKFATGERDANGKDKGIRATMMVWEAALSKYPPNVIEAAAARLTTECPEFPPNLPQFEAICKAVAPRRTYAEQHGLPPVALPAPQEAGLRNPPGFAPKGDHKDWARRIIARHEQGKKIRPILLRFAREALGVA